MRRRDFVRAIVATTVGARAIAAQQTAPPVAQKAPPTPKAPGPLPWMRGLMEVKALAMTPLVADAVAQTDSSFFSPQQIATLRRFCDLLMPPLHGYPGAAEAGTPEFLDFLIGASPADRQQMYQSGLDRLESEAKQRFGTSFTAVDAGQADQLIRPWLRTWMGENAPKDPYERFINVAHNDIRIATTNSQAWADAARLAGQQVPAVDLFWYPSSPIFTGMFAPPSVLHPRISTARHPNQERSNDATNGRCVDYWVGAFRRNGGEDPHRKGHLLRNAQRRAHCRCA